MIENILNFLIVFVAGMVGWVDVDGDVDVLLLLTGCFLLWGYGAQVPADDCWRLAVSTHYKTQNVMLCCFFLPLPAWKSS